MIRVSSLSGCEVILRKLLSFLVVYSRRDYFGLKLAFYKYSVRQWIFLCGIISETSILIFSMELNYLYDFLFACLVCEEYLNLAFVTAYFGVTGMTLRLLFEN